MKSITVTTLIFLCIAIKTQAKTIEINCSYTTDPFEWNINRIEERDNNTYISQ